MANAKFSTLATQLLANAAAVATAAGGTVVTSDITALADLMKTLSLRNDYAIPLIELGAFSLATTQLSPG